MGRITTINRNIMKLKNMFYAPIIIALAALAGCDNDDSGKKPFDFSQFGPLVQNIAECTPGITAVDSVKEHTLPGDLKMTEIAFKARFWNQHIYIVEVDLDRDVTIVSSTPDDNPPTGGHQTLDLHAAAAENHGKTVYIGVNGDVCGSYSIPEGEYDGWKGGLVSAGPFVKDGVIYRSKFAPSTTSAFYIKNDGSAHLEKEEQYRADEQDVRDAIGGWHLLVWDGEIQEIPKADKTHYDPRTCLGMSEDGKKVYFFIMDGRQPPYSYGMYLEDMAGIAKGTGCYRACNLDGGGSTTLVVRDETAEGVSFKVFNRTCATESTAVDGVRPLPNGLLVIASR